jgi:hypothetical protein
MESLIFVKRKNTLHFYKAQKFVKEKFVEILSGPREFDPFRKALN